MAVDVTEGQEFSLKITRGGSIRIGREGFWQTVDHESLHKYGWNAVADAARLVEAMVRGEYTSGA